MRLLLVEDEKRMSQALCEILRQENYDVDCFYDGLSGLDAAESEIYDVIILDVMLPKMNGFEIARELRKCGIHTPILMLTAKSELDDKVTGLGTDVHKGFNNNAGAYNRIHTNAHFQKALFCGTIYLQRRSLL